MKLVAFTQNGHSRIGALEAEEVVDFSVAGSGLPSDMLVFLEQGAAAMDGAREACASGRGRVALADVTLQEINYHTITNYICDKYHQQQHQLSNQ
jgi:hypothetical protein